MQVRDEKFQEEILKEFSSMVETAREYNRKTLELALLFDLNDRDNEDSYYYKYERAMSDADKRPMQRGTELIEEFSKDISFGALNWGNEDLIPRRDPAVNYNKVFKKFLKDNKKYKILNSMAILFNSFGLKYYKMYFGDNRPSNFYININYPLITSRFPILNNVLSGEKGRFNLIERQNELISDISDLIVGSKDKFKELYREEYLYKYKEKLSAGKEDKERIIRIADKLCEDRVKKIIKQIMEVLKDLPITDYYNNYVEENFSEEEVHAVIEALKFLAD